MANGAVTGLVLKDVPEDPPTLDSCPFCALAEAQRLPFKTGLGPLELVHGDLVGPIPVETISSDGPVIVIRSERLLIGLISESPRTNRSLLVFEYSACYSRYPPSTEAERVLIHLLTTFASLRVLE